MDINGYGVRIALVITTIFSMAGSAWADDIRTYGFTVTPKLGSFKLNYADQTLLIRGAETGFSGWYVTEELPITIDSTSSEVVSIEFQRNKDKFSYGAELLHVKNYFYAPSLASSQSDITANYLFATINKSFIKHNDFQVSAGLGAGIVAAELGGQISSESVKAPCTLFVFGFSYHWHRYDITAQYRYVATPFKVRLADAHTTGETDNVHGELDLGGQGFNLGFGVSF